MIPVAVIVLLLAGAAVTIVDPWSDEAVMPGGSADPEADEDPPAAPRDVTAKAGAGTVVLTWSPDETGGPIEGFRVYRDGNLIDTALATETSYEDGNVAPSTVYDYRVEAFGHAFLESESEPIQVRTRSAPTEDAPVKGTFDMRLVLSSVDNITGLKTHTAGWRLTPACAKDPCGVRLVDIHRVFPAMELRRAGKGYLIKGRGRLDLQCAGTPTDVSYRLEFRVTKAGVVDGEWRAERIEGSFEERVAAQLGCSAGVAVYRFTGHLLEHQN
jgi:hypothetical protein